MKFPYKTSNDSQSNPTQAHNKHKIYSGKPKWAKTILNELRMNQAQSNEIVTQPQKDLIEENTIFSSSARYIVTRHLQSITLPYFTSTPITQNSLLQKFKIFRFKFPPPSKRFGTLFLVALSLYRP